MALSLDSRPSLGELARQVCLESEWYDIGVRLGLNPDKLSAIRHTPAKESAKTIDMYKLWLNSQSQQATRRQLIEVLENMELNRQAHDYKKHLKGIADDGDRKQASDLNNTHKPQKSTLPIDGSISPTLSVQIDDLSRLSELVKNGSCHLTVHAHIHACTCVTGRGCEIDLPDFSRDFTHTSDDGRVFQRAGYHQEEQINIKSKGIAAPIKQVNSCTSGDSDRKQALKLSDLKTDKKLQNSILAQVDSSISPALSVQRDDLLHLPEPGKKGSSDSVIFVIDEQLLDPEFDRDFIHNSDDGRVYYRGGYPYKRPYGWKRIALKVKGKYEDDTWLGTPGIRTQSSYGEWPVSYHGILKGGATGTADRGSVEQKGKRLLYGPGFYSTPDIEVAAQYSALVTYNGKRCIVVMQNRVNLKNSKIIPKKETQAGAEYYVTPSSDDIRPYGICIREI